MTQEKRVQLMEKRIESLHLHLLYLTGAVNLLSVNQGELAKLALSKMNQYDYINRQWPKETVDES